MTIAEKIRKIAADARQASFVMARLSSSCKNDLLGNMAQALVDNTPYLVDENRKDLEAGERKGLSAPMLDRLMLDPARIKAMADGLREVAALPDPVGEVTGMWKRPNDLMVGKMRIPLGVIGMIYEARPNVTADAAALASRAATPCCCGGVGGHFFQYRHCRYPSGGDGKGWHSRCGPHGHPVCGAGGSA